MPVISTRGTATKFAYAPLSLPIDTGPPTVGDLYKGGVYLGDIQVGADAYHIIVSPKAAGKLTNVLITGGGGVVPTLTVNDGKANTDLLAPISNLCIAAKSLTINGYSDWYVPSRDEGELMYRVMKNTTTSNYVGVRINARDETGTYQTGENPSTIPPGIAYTATDPPISPLPIFQAGGAWEFDGSPNDVLTTTCVSATLVGGVPGQVYMNWPNGWWNVTNPQFSFSTRVIRREKIT